MNCRFCGSGLDHLFLDLGDQPPANRYLSQEQLGEDEPLFPLKVMVCSKCLLVQLADYNRPEDIFTSDYAYFSSYVKSWVEHARRYVDKVTERFSLNAGSFVVEVASNDGYLLQHFVAKGVPCLGIDPAAKAAEAARAKGVETQVGFFGAEAAARLTRQKGHADLIAGNNVLAHVPDINDFVRGLFILLKPDGVVTMEFPHLARLIENMQFDTIYDEHFSYFSFKTVKKIFRHHGLEIFDVEELPTHGGSLRVFAHHGDCRAHAEQDRVAAMLKQERDMGLEKMDTYLGMAARVEAIRDDFLALIEREKAKGHSIAAFGAAAKGNTFLNYCRAGADVIDFVVDDTPAKQGRFLPQSHVPVVAEQVLRDRRPDVILILPWNVKKDVMDKLDYAREWGARFVTCIPEVRVE